MLVPILFTLAAVLLLLAFEAREVQAGVWVAKPAASAGFLATAIVAGALESAYGWGVLAALSLSWLGDVFLIPRGQKTFLAGLVSFLLAHLAYCLAFVQKGLDPAVGAASLVVVAVPSLLVVRWLRPHVPGELLGPVYAYVVVITGMVALAAAAAVQGGCPLVLAAAAVFYVSDLAVARDAFVAPGFANRLWGLPLYYGAQLAFAWSVQS